MPDECRPAERARSSDAEIEEQAAWCESCAETGWIHVNGDDIVLIGRVLRQLCADLVEAQSEAERLRSRLRVPTDEVLIELLDELWNIPDAACRRRVSDMLCQQSHDLAAAQSESASLREAWTSASGRATEAEQAAIRLGAENERLRNLYIEPKIHTPERWRGKPEDKSA